MIEQVTAEQILDQVTEILQSIGVDPSLIEPSRALIAGESEDPSFIQQAPKQHYQITQEIAQCIFKVHASYENEELREMVTLAAFVLFWLTGLAWVLPQAERVRLEAAQSLARLGLNGEQLVDCQLYIMGQEEMSEWLIALPQVDLDRLPYEPHWLEFTELHQYLRQAGTKAMAERYFTVLERIGGLPARYFDKEIYKTRGTVFSMLDHLDLERSFIDRCFEYVMGEREDFFVRFEMPQVNVAEVPAYVWEQAEAAYEIYRLAHGPAERERMLRFFHLLHHLGGTELFYEIWPSLQKGRMILLDKLFAFDPEHYGPVLVEHLEDPAKAVRERMIELLSRYRGADDQLAKMLKSKDKDAREAAVLIISAWNDDSFQPLLEEALAVEKNDSVRKTLLMLVKGGLPIPDFIPQEEVVETREQFENYCWKHMRPIQKEHLNWLDLNMMPNIRYRDTGEIADEAARRYLMLTYVELKELRRNREAEKVAAFLNTEDIAELAYQVLLTWIIEGSEKKLKWVLYFAAAHGDQRSIDRIKKQVWDWPKDGLVPMTIDAVRALAMTGERSALQFVDGIGRKFRYHSVRKAAATAFEFAGEQMDFDPEALADQVVPDLGFDSRGEKMFHFGNRTFLAQVTSDLQLVLVDDAGKIYKMLPKPEADDDEKQIAKAREEFSTLRKELKELVAEQTVRMDKALSTGRKWTVENWTELFAHNPIMWRLAMGLTWRTYVDGVMQETFHCFEDGTMKTVEGDVYDLPEHAMVGLVKESVAS